MKAKVKCSSLLDANGAKASPEQIREIAEKQNWEIEVKDGETYVIVDVPDDLTEKAFPPRPVLTKEMLAAALEEMTPGGMVKRQSNGVRAMQKLDLELRAPIVSGKRAPFTPPFLKGKRR